jgi:cob(I)alamin adenosyltransferase
MKIYTKTGDSGQTSLLGGKRVSKHHIRIECYGTVDELNAHLGMLLDLTEQEPHRTRIQAIQAYLFTLGSHLAMEPGKHNIKLPPILAEETASLERYIDEMNAVLPEMRNFVLPGGHVAVSQAHISRCVCRRAERQLVYLTEQEEVHPEIVKYINRLSDYLFVLARMLGQILNVQEKPWKPSF